MTAMFDLLKAGDLSAALSAAKGAVRKDPGDPEGRARLFQLFCLNGEWDRAEAQLQTLLTAAERQSPIWKQFEILMRLEASRRACYAEGAAPTIVGEPSDWMAPFSKAFELHQSGDVEAGRVLREEVLGDVPAAAGHIGDTAFDWIMDGDSRLGPLLEAFLPTEGEYCWIPLSSLGSFRVEKPTQINHFVWTPAHFTWSDGKVLHGYLPTRYIGSEATENPDHALARGTDWIDRGDGVFEGVGQRVLMTADDDFPVLEIREARLNG